MKQLSLIIHANLKQSATDFLRGLDVVENFTFSEVEGHGSQAVNDDELSNKDRVVGYIPRLRVEMLLSDEYLEPVLTALRKFQDTK